MRLLSSTFQCHSRLRGNDIVFFELTFELNEKAIVTLFYYKIAAAITILLVTLIAVIYPIKAHRYPKHHHWLDLGDAFASGVFLGAALFHMLPEAISYFQQNMPSVHYPIAELFCAIGFLVLLLLERLALASFKIKQQVAIPYILAMVIMVHSFIEGAVIGINTELTTLSIISIAVLAHKGSESFALSASLAKSVISMKALMTLIIIFAVMTPIGILLGSSVIPFLYAQKAQLLTAGFNAFAAGTFLYMSTLHHVNHHQRLHEAESMVEFVCLLFGVAMMAKIAQWV